MADWRVAEALKHLRTQVDAAFPGRDKSSDGTIGDAAHQATVSQHNPNAQGVVTAEDITNDPAHGLSSRALAEAIIASRDPRVWYIISDRQICNPGDGEAQTRTWQWLPYKGSNPHTEHVHISLLQKPELWDNTADWALPPHGTAPSGTQSGKGSWYSQNPPVWIDTGDRPNSNALGVPDAAQGVAFFDRTTLGNWFEITAPNGVRSTEQQTDIGPSPSTGRVIDISAAAAPRLGYHNPNSFPTDSIFHFRPVAPPTEVAGLPAKTQATAYLEVRSRPPVVTPPPPPPPDLTEIIVEAICKAICDALRPVIAGAIEGTKPPAPMVVAAPVPVPQPVPQPAPQPVPQPVPQPAPAAPPANNWSSLILGALKAAADLHDALTKPK